MTDYKQSPTTEGWNRKCTTLSLVTARCPISLTGQFRVRRVMKWLRRRGQASFTLLVAARTKRHIAIIGESGAQVSVGDLVHLKGCLLYRSGQQVLVIGSLARIAQPGSSVRGHGRAVAHEKLARGQSR